MEVGFDIDGVLTEDGYVENSEEVLKAKRSSIRVPSYAYIISARPKKLQNETDHWLDENGIKYKVMVLMNDYDFREMMRMDTQRGQERLQGEFKAKWCENLSLDLFVEDREEVRKKLIDVCGDRTLILSPEHYEKGNWDKILIDEVQEANSQGLKGGMY